MTRARTGTRIVVAGDAATGKSSLIDTAVSKRFSSEVSAVLEPCRFPLSLLQNDVPMTVIDTPSSSSVEHTSIRAEEFQRADAVILTYACNRLDTLDNLSSYWLPELRRLEVNVPVIIVGCMLDLRDNQQQASLEQSMSPIMKQFPEITTCIECSACRLLLIPQVFYYAQLAILYPIVALVDQERQTWTPQCVKGLTRIFKLCDHDSDGALSDAELNAFHIKCFNAPLHPSEIVGLKRAVKEKMAEGVNERGLTLRGFLFLHAIIVGEHLETMWTILQKFGYNNDIRLDDNFLPPSFKRAPDQSVELTKVALDFLSQIFSKHDNDNDGSICPSELQDLFSTAPDCPWTESPYKGAALTNALGCLTLHGFLSEWTLMTLLEPAKSVEYLKYIMYGGDSTSAIRLTRGRCTDRKKKTSERNVYQCFVFGPQNSGKSALFNKFLERSFFDTYDQNTNERYAVNVVDGTDGRQKFLVLREITEAGVKKLLSDQESLAACDVALFLWAGTSGSSFKKTAELLEEVAGHGEETGYEVPSLIVCGDPYRAYPNPIADVFELCRDMGISEPLFMNSEHIFKKIVITAENPHLSIPNTKARRSRNQFLRLMAVSVAIAGLTINHVFAAIRNSSS